MRLVASSPIAGRGCGSWLSCGAANRECNYATNENRYGSLPPILNPFDYYGVSGFFVAPCWARSALVCSKPVRKFAVWSSLSLSACPGKRWLRFSRQGRKNQPRMAPTRVRQSVMTFSALPKTADDCNGKTVICY